MTKRQEQTYYPKKSLLNGDANLAAPMQTGNRYFKRNRKDREGNADLEGELHPLQQPRCAGG